MRRLFAVTLVGILVLLWVLPVQAQDGLEELPSALESLGEEYANGYVQPVSDAFGATVSAGLFRTADVSEGVLPGLPVDVYLGVSASGALLGSAKTSFSAPQSETITREFTENGSDVLVETTVSVFGRENVPNVLGDTDPSQQLTISTRRIVDRVLEESETRSVTVPPGLVDADVAPLLAPQLGVGSFAGTDVLFRYLPDTDLSYAGSNFGTVGLTGVAVRHDIDQWIPTSLPLNLATQVAWNRLSMSRQDEEIFNASGWAFNVQASKGLPVAPVVVYGGLQVERFTSDYSYTLVTPVGDDLSLNFSQRASSTVRALAGVSISLAVVRLNVDYAAANGNNVVTTGLGVRL